MKKINFMAYREDKKGRPLCDKKGCKIPAVSNYQSGIVHWTINGKDKYTFEELRGDGQVNIFRCEQHDD